MIITQSILDKGMSSKGAWSKKQLELLGVPIIKGFKLIKGWKDRLIGSEVCEANVRQFIGLRDAHIKNNQYANLFGQQKKGDEYTKKARNLFSRLGKKMPWPNITEQERLLLMDYAGQSRFNKADLMFIENISAKIM